MGISMSLDNVVARVPSAQGETRVRNARADRAKHRSPDREINDRVITIGFPQHVAPLELPAFSFL